METDIYIAGARKRLWPLHHDQKASFGEHYTKMAKKDGGNATPRRNCMPQTHPRTGESGRSGLHVIDGVMGRHEHCGALLEP